MNNIFVKRFFVGIVLIAVGAIAGFLLADKGLISPTGFADGYNQQARVSAAQAAKIDPAILYPVTEVVDGDTFKVKIGGKEITVRLLGINTPEVVDPRKPVECFGPEASAEAKTLLSDGKVRLELNPNREKTDYYSRLLAYAFLPDGTFLNKVLVQEGYAREYTVGTPYSYQSDFKAAEAAAKAASKGLWGKCGVEAK
ncbi:thermonuclease family protein [Patescibacteria group bacterium]|nr:thermonuclease family protein [Patescibacteria group bacterium]MDE1946577.1 thermonuclease family protein [Patescibacteria group bacterium]MDE2010862.1 thermonuclease family protein [Patescibacteria group bacterium]MDE2233204.1 thermonuclease family protein [Patescibacteria group bacterium]